MSTSRDDDPNKPVTGYPTGYPPAQSSYNPNGYPPAQSNNYHSNTGTGYPYTAPPPAAYYNHPNPYPAPPYDPSRANFLRRLIIIMIGCFIIFGAITFITWLVLRPHLPDFRVDSASVSSFNASNSQITANWDFGFFVRNPNKKMDIYYDRIETELFYRKEFLSATTLAPFEQENKNETTLKPKFSASGTYVNDYTFSKIAEERRSGTVKFNIRLLAWTRFRSGVWRTRIHLLRVYCEDVTIGFSSNSGVGNLSGGPRECDVDM